MTRIANVKGFGQIAKISEFFGELRDAIEKAAAEELEGKPAAADEVAPIDTAQSPTDTHPTKADKLLIDRSLPVREARLSAFYFFGRAQVIWNALVITLPLDLLLLTLDLRYLATLWSPPLLRDVTLILFFVGLAGLIREPALDLIASFKEYREKLAASLQKSNWIIVLFVLAIIVLQVVESFFEDLSLTPIIMALIIGWGIISSMLQVTSDHKAREEMFAADRILWLEESNKLIFFLSVIPHVAARLISLSAAFYISMGFLDASEFAVYFVASIVLLLALFPQHEHFVIPCSRCSAWTSRVFKNLSHCPECARQKFQAQAVPFNVPTPASEPKKVTLESLLNKYRDFKMERAKKEKKTNKFISHNSSLLHW